MVVWLKEPHAVYIVYGIVLVKLLIKIHVVKTKLTSNDLLAYGNLPTSAMSPKVSNMVFVL